MKISRTPIIYIWSLLAAAAPALTSCSDKDDPNGGGSGNGVEVAIKTNVVLNTKTALIENLENNDEMNVWIDVTSETGAILSSEQMKATNNGGTWTLSNSTRLDKGQTAEIYAVYPYSDKNTNLEAVAVDVATQEDVLYSGSATYASYTSNVATLNMKHALSMIAVNVSKEGYQGDGVISKLRISQPSVIATKGTLNVKNGKVTVTENGDLTVDVNATIGNGGISGLLPGMWVIPFSSKDRPTVKVVMTIDGKEYAADLPEVSMNTGWQYVFHAVLTQNGLAFVPDATEEYALNKSDDEIGELTGHGVIMFTFTGETFNFPLFTGDNIFGNIKADDGTQTNYKIGGKLDLPSSGKRVITVETWNSTGFEVNSLEGIDAIDLSQY